jgi:hypothetical protein
MFTQISRTVHVFKSKIAAKKPFHVLQISDVHYDSVKCDRELLTKHLKQAEKLNALVFINGDLFDLMGGKYDPRSSYSDIRPEYKHINYLDAVIKDAAEYFSKFKVNYFIGRGNHETNISKRLHTDPTDRLAELLRYNGITVATGGYSGWFVYKFEQNNMRFSIIQHYHHGSGGNSPRSKGILSADIDQKKFPDADIITRGHDHQKWHLPTTVQRLSHSYQPQDKTVHHVRTGSYKMLGDGFAGWAVEKGFDRPRLGGWWMTVTLYGTKRTASVSFTEAD